MGVAAKADRTGDHASVVPSGAFDLAHVNSAQQVLETVERRVRGCRDVDVELTELEHIDGTGAVLLVGLLDRLDAGGSHPHLVEGHNDEAARLIALYRSHPPR